VARPDGRRRRRPLNDQDGHDETVVGHADWYSGNLRFDGDRLVAAFDWALTADTEAVIAGLSAGSYTAGGSSAGGLPTPDEVAAFLLDYDSVRTRPFAPRQQRVVAGAASWVIAYNARCELSLLGASAPTVELAHRDRNRYLALRW
jgi:hypothetical protein